jgi:hypothetical protein
MCRRKFKKKKKHTHTHTQDITQAGVARLGEVFHKMHLIDLTIKPRPVRTYLTRGRGSRNKVGPRYGDLIGLTGALWGELGELKMESLDRDTNFKELA